MKIRTASALLFVLLASLPLRAQELKVLECPKRGHATDSMLRTALQKSVEAKTNVEFPAEDSPCDYTASIVKTLNRAINRKSFNSADSHSFVFIRNNDNLFSVERFVFKDSRTAASVGKALEKRKRNTLPLESPTSYDFLLLDNNLLVFIANTNSFRFNEPLIAEIKQHLRAGHVGGE